ncbi:hypothetical protein, partial [Leptospira interrogans]|uniref:hypothetical protein n=1 Tax=Leptospira interrogans TaxID=173 RepID=UPI0002BABDB5
DSISKFHFVKVKNCGKLRISSHFSTIQATILLAIGPNSYLTQIYQPSLYSLFSTSWNLLLGLEQVPFEMR